MSQLSDSLRVTASYRQILKIALPVSMALLVPQLNYLTNNIFISVIGETELATAGITGVFYLIFALIGNGLNSGLQALIARRAGQNRTDEIGKLFSQAIWLSLLFAGVSVLCIYLFSPIFFRLVLHHNKVALEATQFMRIRIWGLPFLYLFLVANAFLVGTNNSRFLKYGFFIQAGINILLDYLLIFGHWGLPAYGFDGAAIGSVLSEILGLLTVALIIFYKKFPQQFSLFKFRSFDKKIITLILRTTSPLIAQFLLSVCGWFLFYILVEHTGERQLAISNAMRNVFGIVGIFGWAFATSSNAMASNIIGQGKENEVLGLVHKIVKLSVLFTLSLCLFINIAPHIFLNIFGRSELFNEEAIPVLRMVTLGILVMCVATIWLNAITATGRTAINLKIEVIAILIYTAYIYTVINVWHKPLVWAWSAEIVYWSVILIFSWGYMRKGKWKGHDF